MIPFLYWINFGSQVRDDDEEQAEAALDLRIFFNSSGWSDVMGGQSSYIARYLVNIGLSPCCL